MITRRSRQHGLSLIGWVVMLMVVVVFATAAFRMVPAYIEYGTIRGVINTVLEEAGAKHQSPREVRTAIGKRFAINQVDALGSRDLHIDKKDGRLSVGLDYQVQEPLFYNVSLIMHFKHTFTGQDGQ